MVLDFFLVFFSMNLIAEFPGNLHFIAVADVPIASTKLNTFNPHACRSRFMKFQRALGLMSFNKYNETLKVQSFTQRVYKHTCFFYIQTNLVSFKVQMKSMIMEDIRVTLNKSRKMILHTFPQSSWIESALIA